MTGGEGGRGRGRDNTLHIASELLGLTEYMMEERGEREEGYGEEREGSNLVNILILILKLKSECERELKK